jgi:hypothetical protein
MDATPMRCDDSGVILPPEVSGRAGNSNSGRATKEVNCVNQGEREAVRPAEARSSHPPYEVAAGVKAGSAERVALERAILGSGAPGADAPVTASKDARAMKRGELDHESWPAMKREEALRNMTIDAKNGNVYAKTERQKRERKLTTDKERCAKGKHMDSK